MKQEVITELLAPAVTNMLFGLDRIKKILSFLKNPQNNYQVVHITGTNGKGSTATFIETGLNHAGFRVGKFTSPHIRKINENITLNKEEISDEDLEKLFFVVKSAMASCNIVLSPFEMLTVIMFCYFSEKHIDYLVLEVGMGGTNDATNVIQNPCCVVITNIALEHTQWLGSTIEEISSEKAGIIKGCPVIIADSSPALIKAVYKKTNQVINILDKYDISIDLDYTVYKTKLNTYNKVNGSSNSYLLNLFGRFQAYNFLCAVEVLKLLKISEPSISQAAETAIWNGRLQLISKNPDVFLDATHNEYGAKYLYETFYNKFKKNEIVIVTSILKDKNIIGMLHYFSNITNNIIFTSIKSTDRGLLADNMYQIAYKEDLLNKFNAFSIDSPTKAFEFAQSLNKKLTLVTGSLYLLNELSHNLT